jgi:predicted Zn-dependent protease with MMP-like domain
MPEYEERRPDGEVSAIVAHLTIHEMAERWGISVEAAYALVIASLRG